MSEAQISWRRASRGLYFLGFGVLFLLTTLDVIPGSFWFEALAYWPLILVAIGIRMIFQRSPAPWGVLLSPLVIFSTLAWVAATQPAEARTGWGGLVADAPRSLDRWTFEGHMALTELDLRSAELPANRLVEGRVSPADQRSLRIRDWRGGTRVELSSVKHRLIGINVIPGLHGAWDLGLANSLPMEMILKGAFTGGGADLSTARLSGLDLEGAFHNLELRLPRPESTVRLSVEGAFNDIEILVPPEVPVSVSSDGAINVVDGRPDPPRSGVPGYRLRVEGFMNHVEILSDPDAPPPGPATMEGDGSAGPDPVDPPGGSSLPSGA